MPGLSGPAGPQNRNRNRRQRKDESFLLHQPRQLAVDNPGQPTPNASPAVISRVNGHLSPAMLAVNFG